ncbi:MAG: hypothetical protein ABIF77_16680 [bacterium]
MRWLAFVALSLLLIVAGSVLAGPGSGKSIKDRVPLEPYMGARASETEPNDTCGEANGPFSPELGIEAELEPNDMDWYMFEFTAGDTVLFETRPVEGEPEVDTVVSLRSDCNTIIDDDDDDDTGLGYYSMIEFAVETTGTYYFVVTGYDNIQDGNYALVVTYPDPPNTTCATAIPLNPHIGYSILLNTCGGGNNYDPGDQTCLFYAMPGSDLVYYIDMEQGTSLDIILENTHDAGMYLITDCSDPVNSCVVGVDGWYTGGTEHLEDFIVPETGRYYLIIDDWGDGCGWAMITMTSSVPNQTRSWGAVKSLYR